MWRWVGVVAVAGCSFTSGVDPATDAPVSKDPNATDAMPPGAVCFGSAPFGFCFATKPIAMLTFDGGSCDTDMCSCDGTSGQTVTISGVPTCVFAGATIEIVSIVRGKGSVPLVFAATGSLTVGGELDVDSSTSGDVGAAADDVSCAGSATTWGASAMTGTPCGGGGAGGSFGTAGGNGGSCNTSASNASGVGGTSGSAVTTPVDVLRGGCPGGSGAAGNSGSGGPPAHGGGALYLVSLGTMSLETAVINASGAGGNAGSDGRGGGGGGGAGGMIVIDAPTIAASGAIVFANGGGGGGAADGGNNGDPGTDPLAATALDQALGGDGGGVADSVGGEGGAGSNLPEDGTSKTDTSAGGGGAGGGVGVIRVRNAPLGGATVSPPPTN
jgi:hypothetical protein